MITEEMILTAETILGNSPRVGATSMIPIGKAELLDARQLATVEMNNLAKNMAGPLAEYIVKGYLGPTGDIARNILTTNVEGAPGGHTVLTAHVNLLSVAEMSYLTTVIMKFRQARMAASYDGATTPRMN